MHKLTSCSWLLIGMVGAIMLLSACGQNNLYERRSTIKQMNWKQDAPVQDSLLITDTTSLYDVYVCIRHTDAYRYNNIWMNVFLKNSRDTLINRKVELQLGSDASGWEGTGLNDIWDVRKKLNVTPVKFKNSGLYYYKLNQCMRDNPLQSVMSVGLRIEKANNN